MENVALSYFLDRELSVQFSIISAKAELSLLPMEAAFVGDEGAFFQDKTIEQIPGCSLSIANRSNGHSYVTRTLTSSCVIFA